MKEIRKPQEQIYQILGPGSFSKGVAYKTTSLMIGCEFPDGAMIYHTLLKCIAFLSLSGYRALLSGNDPQDSEEREYLYSRYFFVPENQDECKNVREIRGLMSMMMKKKGLTGFTILPTTDCNARCFYCYEAGCRKMTMSMAQADDVAEWILKVSVPKKQITLNWFGGEPLYNVAAIDRIVKRIKESGREYVSKMVSNGYLFDEDMVKRAKEEWNLQGIQITLDGTEQVYNERKNFIYQEGESPFRRVIRNIRLLAEAEIKVDVRLNMDDENGQDLRILAKQLLSEFRGQKHVNVYCHLLYQVSGEGSKCYEDYFRFRDELSDMGFSRSGILRPGLKMNRCMADSDEGEVILPDGSLFRCEHFNESLPSHGSIYSEERNEEILKQWHEYQADVPECRECFYYPDCLRLKHCPEETCSCPAEQREIRRGLYLDGLRGTYRKMKEEGSEV